MENYRPSAPALHPSPNPGFGELLQHLRGHAAVSQLHLALSGGLSTRHLSYLETGKARPSEATIARIAGALGLPAAEHNGLRMTAGFRAKALPLATNALDAPAIRDTLDMMLCGSPHLPILVKDRNWDVVAYNALADDWLFALTGVRYSTRTSPLNVLELVFAPQLFRPAIENWREVAAALVARIRGETGFAADSPEFVEIVGEIANYETFTELWAAVGSAAASPSTTYRFRNGSREPTEFEAVRTSLGSPHDAILSGIRLYTFYPRNESARRALGRS